MTTSEQRIDKLEEALTRLIETVNQAERSNAVAHAEIVHNLGAVQKELSRHSAVEDEHHDIIFGKDGQPGVLDLSRQNTAVLKRLANLGWAVAGSAAIGVLGFLVHLYRTMP